jgi:hypothetical protein
LEEGDVEQALRDGYLRKWQQDLELLWWKHKHPMSKKYGPNRKMCC